MTTQGGLFTIDLSWNSIPIEKRVRTVRADPRARLVWQLWRQLFSAQSTVHVSRWAGHVLEGKPPFHGDPQSAAAAARMMRQIARRHRLAEICVERIAALDAKGAA